MALLHRNRSAPVVWVRDTLGLTDGNLASHAAKLVEAGYIEQRRALAARGFQVRMTITAAGDAAYLAYRQALREMLGEGPAAHGDAPVRRPAPAGEPSATDRPS